MHFMHLEPATVAATVVKFAFTEHDNIATGVPHLLLAFMFAVVY